MIDRSEVNRALAKAIAYKQCGKDMMAAQWAARLVDLLECADILTDDARTMGQVK
jgi:hypothetical protein